MTFQCPAQGPIDNIYSIKRLDGRSLKYCFIMSSHFKSCLNLVKLNKQCLIGCSGGSFASLASVILEGLMKDLKMKNVPNFFYEFKIPERFEKILETLKLEDFNDLIKEFFPHGARGLRQVHRAVLVLGGNDVSDILRNKITESQVILAARICIHYLLNFGGRHLEVVVVPPFPRHQLSQNEKENITEVFAERSINIFQQLKMTYQNQENVIFLDEMTFHLAKHNPTLYWDGVHLVQRPEVQLELMVKPLASRLGHW